MTALQWSGHPEAVQRNCMQFVVLVEQLPSLAQRAAEVNCVGLVQEAPAPQLAPVVTVHVPTLPGTLQAWQAAPQVLLQQTPSTQLPRLHWLLAVHVAPSPCFELQLPGVVVFPVQ